MDIAEKTLQLKQDFDDVYEAGKKSQYDEFWDNFQEEGNLQNYSRRFANWRSKILRPKYDIKPSRVDYMFLDIFPDYRSKGYSIKKCFAEAGITLDTSLCTKFEYMIYYGYATDVPDLDTRNASSLNAIFNYARMLQSAKLIVKNDGSQTWNNSFESASALMNFEIEGVIGNNFDIHYSSQLTKASIESIVNALSNTTTGKTVTFNKTAKTNAFTDSEWATLIATKPNWTFSLA